MEQKKIAFKKSVSEIVEKILWDNGVQETLSDYRDKICKGIKPYFDILHKIINDIAADKINDVIFLSNIKQELNVSEQVANNILKDVKEKILPLVKVVTTTEIEPQLEGPITALPVNLIDETKKSIPKTPIEKVATPPAEKIIIPTKRRVKNIAKPIEQVKQNIQQPQGPDSYREPIE